MNRGWWGVRLIGAFDEALTVRAGHLRSKAPTPVRFTLRKTRAITASF